MATCYNRYTRQYYYCRSTWSSWGRWVLLGCLIAAGLLIFLIISCLTARRRRKAGRKPMYGTGWTAAGPFNNNAAKPQTEYQQAAPAYNNTPAYNSNTGTGTNGGYYGAQGGQNQSYFGGQQTGNEMQPPPNAYRSEAAYAPPAGPPPNKY